jgi:uracil-DNA glycosylase
MTNYVPGYGCSSAKIVIVGEAPGANEVTTGVPFSGPAGNLLDECLRFAGIDRNDIYLTNVCKVRPPNNDLKKLCTIGHSTEEFLPQLWLELESINPNCIIAVGALALETLCNLKGIEKYRGSILKCHRTGHKVIPTLHPASLFHTEGGKLHPWKELSWIKMDVKRAAEQSLFKEIRLPTRNLRIAQSSVDVIRFVEQTDATASVALDVETWKTWPQCIGLAFTPYEALSIPLFNEGSGSGEIHIHDLLEIWKVLSEFLNDTRLNIMAQNAKFDEKRCRQVGLQWHDCHFDMAMAWHVLYPEFPKKLQFISSILTEEPYYKDEGKEFNNKDAKASFKQWLLYNAKDAAVEYECCEKIISILREMNLESFFFDKIMPLHRLYSNMEDVGILIDLEINKQLGTKYEKLRKEKQEELVQNITEGDKDLYEVYKNFNVMSNGPKNQVAKLIFGFMKLPVRAGTDDETLKSLANNVCKKKREKDILLGILEVRKLRKTIGTYIDAKPSEPDFKRFGDCVRYLDNNRPRIHTQCNINGAETGRTSTGILQPPVCNGKEGIALQTMTKHEDAQIESAGGSDLRAQFIADEDFVFIEPDLSQAEDRVVCVLARDWGALKNYEKTHYNKNKYGLKDDRHTLTTMSVCGLSFDEVTDYHRQIGKKTRHAGNYKMGKHMHMLNLAKFAGIFISEWAAGKQLEKFHADNPQIEGVFHEEIKQALQNNDCVLITPHGRRRQFFNRWGDELLKEAFAFIPQATISDQVKFAMLRIKDRLGSSYHTKFFFLEESHDSFLALCHVSIISMANNIIKEELERSISFRNCTLSRNYDLIIPCDIKVGKRWIEKSEVYPDGMEKLKEMVA